MNGSVCAFGGCLLIFLSIVMITEYINRKSAIGVWGKFAEKTGLSLNPGHFWSYPEVKGFYKGLKCDLYLIRTQYMGITMGFPSIVDFSLNIYSPGYPINLGISYEGQDIQSGDFDFDKRFKIKSLIPEKVNEILTREVLKEILCYKDHLINILVDGKTITTEHRRNDWLNADKLADVTETMWKLSQSITGNRQIEDKIEPDMKNICPICNKEISSDNRFCINCGRKI